MKSKRCPIIFVRVRFEEQKKKKGVCTSKKKKRKGKERKGRRISLIKSWHHQDARDEHVIINDSFFLGRTRDDQHHPKAKGEREREREREHNQSTNHPAKRESDVEHRGVDQKRLLLDALCFLERLVQ